MGNTQTTRLIEACKSNDERMANIFIDAYDNDSVDAFGYTALMWACRNNMTNIAMKLIAKGKSKPEQWDDYNDVTALMFACSNNMTEVALALIATNDSVPWKANKVGYTALMLACDHGNTDIVRALLRTGLSQPNHISPQNVTAFYIACEKGHNKIANMLLWHEVLYDLTPGEEVISNGLFASPTHVKRLTAYELAQRNNMTDVVKAIDEMRKQVI